MKIKAILFDIDGTLIDAREWHKIALDEALAIFGVEISEELHNSKLDGLSTRKKLEFLTEVNGFPKDLHEIVFAVKQDRTLRIAATNCYPIVSIQILLMRLELLGLKLVVVTNSIRETSEYMLRYSGILDFFQFIVTNEDVTNPKPSPEGYILACQKLGLDASEVVVIEDGDYGVIAAQAAGIQRIIRVNEPSEVSIDLLEEYIGDSYEY